MCDRGVLRLSSTRTAVHTRTPLHNVVRGHSVTGCDPCELCHLNLLPLRLWTSLETHRSPQQVFVFHVRMLSVLLWKLDIITTQRSDHPIQGHLVTSSSPSSLEASLLVETTRQSYSRFCPIDHTHRILASQRRSSPPLIHTTTVLQPTRPEPHSRPVVLV